MQRRCARERSRQTSRLRPQSQILCRQRVRVVRQQAQHPEGCRSLSPRRHDPANESSCFGRAGEGARPAGAGRPSPRKPNAIGWQLRWRSRCLARSVEKRIVPFATRCGCAPTKPVHRRAESPPRSGRVGVGREVRAGRAALSPASKPGPKLHRRDGQTVCAEPRQ